MTIGPLSQARPLPEELRSVHLIGVGGAGMSGIARILLARGAELSGSDAREGRVLNALRALGARIVVGHDAANVGRAQTVVVSTAIREANPELQEARRRGLRVLPRAAALAGVMAGSRGIAVAGTHGKTTTTSMLTVVLQEAGLDPSFAIGGDLNEPGSNAHAGAGDVFVAEADESDGSFLLLSPYAAVVTNVEAEHLDHYGSAEAVHAAFRAFIERIDPSGFIVLCADDPGAAALVAAARSRGLRVVTYGRSVASDVAVLETWTDGPQARYVARVGSAPVEGRAGDVTPVEIASVDVALRVPGMHNVLNSAGVLAAATALGVPPAAAAAGLASYRGVRRRFDDRGSVGGVRVVDDYAHHPTEVRATLSAARGVAGGGRLLVAFQPHRYSRTAVFAAELGEALALADLVVVMDVYAAGEDAQPGVDGAVVADAIPLPPGRVRYVPSWSQVAGVMAGLARPGDLVLTMGAGDVTLLGPELLRVLAESR